MCVKLISKKYKLKLFHFYRVYRFFYAQSYVFILYFILLIILLTTINNFFCAQLCCSDWYFLTLCDNLSYLIQFILIHIITYFYLWCFRWKKNIYIRASIVLSDTCVSHATLIKITSTVIKNAKIKMSLVLY